MSGPVVPRDVWLEILARLGPGLDAVRCLSVCRSWRAILLSDMWYLRAIQSVGKPTNAFIFGAQSGLDPNRPTGRQKRWTDYDEYAVQAPALQLRKQMWDATSAKQLWKIVCSAPSKTVLAVALNRYWRFQDAPLWKLCGRTELNEDEQAEMVRILLAVGAEVDLTGGSGVRTTPLQQATRAARPKVVTLLLLAGAVVDKYGGSFQQTVLTLAAGEIGSVELVRKFVSSGADLAAVDEDTFLPIHRAIQYKRLGVIEYFARLLRWCPQQVDAPPLLYYSDATFALLPSKEETLELCAAIDWSVGCEHLLKIGCFAEREWTTFLFPLSERSPSVRRMLQPYLGEKGLTPLETLRLMCLSDIPKDAKFPPDGVTNEEVVREICLARAFGILRENRFPLSEFLHIYLSKILKTGRMFTQADCEHAMESLDTKFPYLWDIVYMMEYAERHYGRREDVLFDVINVDRVQDLIKNQHVHGFDFAMTLRHLYFAKKSQMSPKGLRVSVLTRSASDESVPVRAAEVAAATLLDPTKLDVDSIRGWLNAVVSTPLRKFVFRIVFNEADSTTAAYDALAPPGKDLAFDFLRDLREVEEEARERKGKFLVPRDVVVGEPKAGASAAAALEAMREEEDRETQGESAEEEGKGAAPALFGPPALPAVFEGAGEDEKKAAPALFGPPALPAVIDGEGREEKKPAPENDNNGNGNNDNNDIFANNDDNAPPRRGAVRGVFDAIFGGRWGRGRAWSDDEQRSDDEDPPEPMDEADRRIGELADVITPAVSGVPWDSHYNYVGGSQWSAKTARANVKETLGVKISMIRSRHAAVAIPKNRYDPYNPAPEENYEVEAEEEEDHE